MARVGGGGGRQGVPRAALRGHTRLLKSSARDHAEPLEVGPRTGSQRTGASGAPAPSPPAGVGRGGRSAAPGRQGSLSRARCELAKWRLPGRSERALGASVLTFETLDGRTGLTGAGRGAGGEGRGCVWGGGGAVTLSRGGGRAFLPPDLPAPVPGLYGPDERDPTTQGRRSAQDREPGKLHPGSRLIHLPREWPGPDICALRGSSVS